MNANKKVYLVISKDGNYIVVLETPCFAINIWLEGVDN